MNSRIVGDNEQNLYLPRFPLDAVPIVAVTSFALNGDRVKTPGAGCGACIEKPIDPDRFATPVETVVAAGRTRQGDAP